MVLSDRTIRAEIEAGRIVVRPLRPEHDPAVERRRARRPPLPRLPQRPLPVHRRPPADGGPDRAGRGRGRRARSSSTRASSCSARRWSGCGCPTTSSRAWRARSSRAPRPADPHTAGFVDAGFEGNLTLELSNVANLPITIYHGMPIGQISFMRMDAPVERPYGRRDGLASTRARRSPRPAASTSTSSASRPCGSRRPVRAAGPYAVPSARCQTLDHWRLAIVLVIALMIFGPKRLPELGKSLGNGMREFKDSITGKDDDEDEERPSPPRSRAAEPSRRARRGRGRHRAPQA